MANLLSEFPLTSFEQWREKIKTDLKGKLLEDLSWESEIGTISPILTNEKRTLVSNLGIEKNTDVYTGNYRLFNIEKIDVKNAKNQDVLNALKQGFDALYLYNIDDVSALKNRLKGVDLNAIHLYLEPSKNIASTAIVDFLNQYPQDVVRGGLIGNNEPLNGLKQSDFTQYFVDFSSKEKVLNQVFQAIFQGVDLLEKANETDEDLELFSKNITFLFSMGQSFFVEIAKIRAFKTLWAIVLNQYKIPHHSPKIIVQTNDETYDKTDVYNNVLKATTTAMSAILAGVDGLFIEPIVGENDEQYELLRRVTKNIPILLQDESFMNQNIDVVAGSYYIEELTNKIEKKVWELLQKS